MEDYRTFILYVKDILEEYTDEEEEGHYLKQSDIISLLDQKGIKADRRSVSRAISALEENYGLSISHVRGKGYAMKGRRFDISEAIMMINALYASPDISLKMADDMAKSIGEMFSLYQRKKFSSFYLSGNTYKSDNPDVLYNIERINEAIDKHRKISFRYSDIDGSFKNGAYKRNGYQYVFSPSYLFNKNGILYCIGVTGNHTDISVYSVERIKEIEILDDVSVDIHEIDKQFYLPKYLRDHLYMIPDDEIIDVIVKVSSSEMTNRIRRTFGDNASFCDGSKDRIMIHNGKRCIYSWLKGFGEDIEVVSPKEMKDMLYRYGEMLQEKNQ